jgi:DNA-binding CsgD family transcriptional regulator
VADWIGRTVSQDRESHYQEADDPAPDLPVNSLEFKPARDARSVPAPQPMAVVAQSPLLTALIDTLDLLNAQARAYERAIPPNNYPARAAVSALGELARQALTEARDLAASLEVRPSGKHPFSPREFEVLTLAAEGLTNKEIAYRLGLSERTIQFHMNSVFNRTGTSSRTEAVAMALRQGWLAAR